MELQKVGLPELLNIDGLTQSIQSLLDGKISNLTSASPVNAVNASGTLTLSANVTNTETVTIGARTYTFKTVLTGVANEVLIGATANDSAANIKKAINNDGVAGTDYGTGTVAHADVTATVLNAVVTVTAKTAGIVGNAIPTTETCANGAFGGATLSGGVNGTVSTSLGLWNYDASYLYWTTAANTIADKNWRRIALGTAY